MTRMADRSTTIKSLKHNLSIKLAHSSACPGPREHTSKPSHNGRRYMQSDSCNIHSGHPRVCQETSRHTMEILSRARQCPSQDCRHAITVKLQTRGAPSGDRKLWRRTMIVFFVTGEEGEMGILFAAIEFSLRTNSVILSRRERNAREAFY